MGIITMHFFFLYLPVVAALRFQTPSSNFSELKEKNSADEKTSQAWCMQFPYCPSGCSMWCAPEAPAPASTLPTAVRAGVSRSNSHLGHRKHHHHHNRRRKSNVHEHDHFIVKFVLDFKDTYDKALKDDTDFQDALFAAFASKFSMTISQAKSKCSLKITVTTLLFADLMEVGEVVERAAGKLQVEAKFTDLDVINKNLLFTDSFKTAFPTKVVEKYKAATKKTLAFDMNKPELQTTTTTTTTTTVTRASVEVLVAKLAVTFTKLPAGKTTDELKTDKNFQKLVIAGLAASLKMTEKEAIAKIKKIVIGFKVLSLSLVQIDAGGAKATKYSMSAQISFEKTAEILKLMEVAAVNAALVEKKKKDADDKKILAAKGLTDAKADLVAKKKKVDASALLVKAAQVSVDEATKLKDVVKIAAAKKKKKDLVDAYDVLAAEVVTATADETKADTANTKAKDAVDVLNEAKKAAAKVVTDAMGKKGDAMNTEAAALLLAVKNKVAAGALLVTAAQESIDKVTKLKDAVKIAAAVKAKKDLEAAQASLAKQQQNAEEEEKLQKLFASDAVTASEVEPPETKVTEDIILEPTTTTTTTTTTDVGTTTTDVGSGC